MTGENLGWLAEHIGPISSDMSVFHRVDDIMAMRTADLFARVRYLTHYAGALAQYVKSEHADRPELPTSYAQPVDDPDNTPAHVVAQKRRAAMLAKFPADVAAGGVVEISAEEMEREVMSGG